MSDSMPPAELSKERECQHPWGSVRQRQAELRVAGSIIDTYEVMFCTDCERILEEL